MFVQRLSCALITKSTMNVYLIKIQLFSKDFNYKCEIMLPKKLFSYIFLVMKIMIICRKIFKYLIQANNFIYWARRGFSLYKLCKVVLEWILGRCKIGQYFADQSEMEFRLLQFYGPSLGKV